jgi:hypothetical protein
MMIPPEWILGPSALATTGAAIRITQKLTRLVVAIENLEKATKKMRAQVDEHENRLNRSGL